MSLFKPKDSNSHQLNSSDGKPFISPTVQQMAQRKEESEKGADSGEGQNDTKVSENSFIKPQATIQRKSAKTASKDSKVETTDATNDEKQSSDQEQGTSAEANEAEQVQKSTIEVSQEPSVDGKTAKYSFIYGDKQRNISVNGSKLIMSEFTAAEVMNFRVDGAYEGNPSVMYKDQSMGFKLMLLDIMKPDAGDSFTVYFKQDDGRTPVQITYTMGTIKSASQAESSEGDGSKQGESSDPTPKESAEVTESSNSEATVGPYWTHAWRTDRFGNETVFIWEVGGKRRYSNGDKGYSYIRKMAALLPGDTGYDARFERYKQRPQVGEGNNAKLNFWVKRTPGWDNPDHVDNGTADFNDLAEFKDSPTNRKGTGFYYMGYVFDPLIYEKLAQQKRDRQNAGFIGNHTNYTGFVNAPNGIILHDTPTPADKGYLSKQGNPDFIIPLNQPITVIAEANQDNEGWVMIKTANGNEGWIERNFISKEPKPQTDQIFDTYTVKEGDNLEGLINSYYKNYPSSTGNDKRTVALAIYLYNKDKPGSGVYRDQSEYKAAGSWKDSVDPWMKETRANYASVKLYTGGEVILPPVEYIEKMRRLGEVEKRPDFVNVMIEGGRMLQGFIAGVGVGFWDAIVETGEDLYNMIVDIFTGEIFNQIGDMFSMFMEKGLSGIWDMIKEFGTSTWEEVQAAWNNPNPYERGKYFGEILGMILFEVVLALLTWGIGSAVRNSARATKILKWFPNMNKKKIVPNDVDNYADDIRRMNKDKDLDRDKKNGDQDKDKDKDSEDNKAEDAKALLVAKAYVEIEDAKDPSPDAKVVVGVLNKMPGAKLSGGKKYKSKPNGLGEGHFEIYYNPIVKKDFTQGKAKNRREKLVKSIKKIIEDAKNGKIRRKSDYHGRLDNTKELEILSEPDAVYKSTGKSERLIFRKGDDIVVLDGKGATKGQAVTSYGPSGPRGDSGASIFGGSSTDPGLPIKHDDIINGSIPTPSGGVLAPAELINL